MTRKKIHSFKEEYVKTMRIAAVVALAAALVIAIAAPALAEGYNDPLTHTRANGDFSGPHGGYTTTTNKCQDCHSTHYASGSYVLLRANSREAACDYCHGGGGGSAINIQMDNDYNLTADITVGQDASAITTTTMGYGTGHTLGYQGNAPTDIQPAFSSEQGLACFDCHTPHGNSARVLEAFGIPGRPAGEGEVTAVYGVSFMAAQMYRIQESMNVIFDFGDFNGYTGQAYPQDSYMGIPDDLSMLPHDLDGSAITKWTGAATVLDTVMGTDAGIGSEIASAGANFGAWMTAGGTPKAPTNAQMFAWRTNPANFTGSQTNGYDQLSDTGVGALFALFGAPNMDLVDLFMSWKVYWGTDVDQGNIVTGFLNMGDWQQSDAPGYAGYAPVANPTVEIWHKPLFPKGRFLLVKNPDTGDDFSITNGGINDFDGMGFQMFDLADDGNVNGSVTLAQFEASGMTEGSPDMSIDFGTGAPSAPSGKKVGIDWEWPLGPAATWGPYFYTDSNERFPLAFPWAPKGVSMENEFCTSCHDGAAGESNEAATVWIPNASDSSTGTYETAYSHDSNARGCARAQFLNPDDGNNFGPHCRNCHTGAAACEQCHDASGSNWNGGSAFAQVTTGSYDATGNLMTEGVSGYQAADNHRSYAGADINGQCIDGGFSFPHRTLGANMLKDSLYGVDFDGSPIVAGQARTDLATVLSDFGAGYFTTGWDATAGTTDDAVSWNATSAIAGQAADNLDSVCIDCHGDATYWNGDNEDYYADFFSGDPLSQTGAGWSVQGWELLLKGLP